MSNVSLKDIEDLIKDHKSLQEKHTYYVMAANLTAIGYTIQTLKDAVIATELLYVLMALLSWGISLLCGNFLINNLLNSYTLTRNIKDVAFKEYPDWEERLYQLSGRVAKNNRKTVKNYNLQFAFLLIGIVFFLIWTYHLISLNTIAK